MGNYTHGKWINHPIFNQFKFSLIITECSIANKIKQKISENIVQNYGLTTFTDIEKFIIKNKNSNFILYNMIDYDANFKMYTNMRLWK